MRKSMLLPTAHSVPVASEFTTDQVPLAHCWKVYEVMQFQRPSVGQAEPGVSGDPEEDVLLES